MAKVIKLFDSSSVSGDQIAITDLPVGDTIVGLAAVQTLTNKTLTAPVLGGSVTGTYTLAGTPTITNPTVNAAAGTVVVPTSAAPAQTTEGSVVWDSDDDLLTVGDGASRKIMCDTAGTQTLTNKTLTAPTISGGGTVTGMIQGDIKASSADVTFTSNVTLANVTGLTAISLTAAGTYYFELMLQTNMSTNGGISVALKYTTATITSGQISSTTLAASSMACALSTTVADATKWVDDKAAAWKVVLIKGTLIVNAGGTVAVQACQNTSDADTTTVYKGSTAKFRRVA